MRLTCPVTGGEVAVRKDARVVAVWSPCHQPHRAALPHWSLEPGQTSGRGRWTARDGHDRLESPPYSQMT